jgi:tetratricopeptide (TPR) repeat protein
MSMGVCLAVIAAGCGAAPEEAAGEAGKVPITCASDDARSAYLTGRELQENLRATDSRQHFQRASEIDPGFALAHLALANTATTNTEFFEALARASEVSGNASAGERLMVDALLAGVNSEPELQKQLLEELVATYPEDERAHQLAGIFFFGRQEYDRAIEHHRRSTEINPEFAPAYNQLGYAMRFAGDYAGAEQAFQRYIELIPGEPNPYDSYAELLMKMGRFDESIVQYERALEQNPEFIASYVGIANNQMFKGEFDGARNTLALLESRARTDAERRQACTWLSRSFVLEGDFENALAEIQRRYDIAAETDDLGAMSADVNLMGDILLHAGRADEAAPKYTESVALSNRSVATEEAKEAVRRNHIADVVRVSLAQGDIDAAAEKAAEYRQQVEVHQIPFEMWQSHELFGLIALARSEYQAAVEELQRANRQDARVLLAEAKALWGAGDDENARDVCSRAAHLNALNQVPQNYAFARSEALALLEQ